MSDHTCARFESANTTLMLSARKSVLILARAAGATLASGFIPGHAWVAYPGSMDCVDGCDFVACGWPFPFVIDHPGISPGGSASLFGWFLGLDMLRPGHLAATFVFWLCVLAAADRVMSRRK